MGQEASIFVLHFGLRIHWPDNGPDKVFILDLPAGIFHRARGEAFRIPDMIGRLVGCFHDDRWLTKAGVRGCARLGMVAVQGREAAFGTPMPIEAYEKSSRL